MPCMVDGGQLEPRGQLGEAHPTGALQRGEHPDRAVDRLDHASPSPADISGLLRSTRITGVCVQHHIRQYRMTFEIRRAPNGSRLATQDLRRTSWTRPSLAQRLGAEVIGTAFLVFIGVGSVPATLIVNGDAPFTMADLGMISLAFGTDRRRDRLRPRPHRRQPHQPGGHARARGHRQVPVVAGARLHRRAGRRRDRRRRRDHRRARHEGQRRRPRASRRTATSAAVQAFTAEFVGTFILVFTDLRRDPPQGRGRLRRRRDRPGRVRGDHPGRTDHRRLDQPGPHLRPDARPADRRRHGEVEPAARLPRRRAASPASLAALARTSADLATTAGPASTGDPSPDRQSRRLEPDHR